MIPHFYANTAELSRPCAVDIEDTSAFADETFHFAHAFAGLDFGLSRSFSSKDTFFDFLSYFQAFFVLSTSFLLSCRPSAFRVGAFWWGFSQITHHSLTAIPISKHCHNFAMLRLFPPALRRDDGIVSLYVLFDFAAAHVSHDSPSMADYLLFAPIYLCLLLLRFRAPTAGTAARALTAMPMVELLGRQRDALDTGHTLRSPLEIPAKRRCDAGHAGASFAFFQISRDER